MATWPRTTRSLSWSTEGPRANLPRLGQRDGRAPSRRLSWVVGRIRAAAGFGCFKSQAVPCLFERLYSRKRATSRDQCSPTQTEISPAKPCCDCQHDRHMKTALTKQAEQAGRLILIQRPHFFPLSSWRLPPPNGVFVEPVAAISPPGRTPYAADDGNGRRSGLRVPPFAVLPSLGQRAAVESLYVKG